MRLLAVRRGSESIAVITLSFSHDCGVETNGAYRIRGCLSAITAKRNETYTAFPYSFHFLSSGRLSSRQDTQKSVPRLSLEKVSRSEYE